MTQAAEPEVSHENTDYPSIGPECFTNRDATVISYKGENYYRACGELVHTFPPGHPSGNYQTSCVKRTNHPDRDWHEDYDGRVRNSRTGFTIDHESDSHKMAIPVPRIHPQGTPITRQGIQDAWDLFVKPNQDAGEIQTMEMRTLMAVLRTVNSFLPDEEVNNEADDNLDTSGNDSEGATASIAGGPGDEDRAQATEAYSVLGDDSGDRQGNDDQPERPSDSAGGHSQES